MTGGMAALARASVSVGDKTEAAGSNEGAESTTREKRPIRYHE